MVIDIGVHCGLRGARRGRRRQLDLRQGLAAAQQRTPTWPRRFLRFELDRYLGWPGQAPSYKLGERLWLQLRDESRARAGDAFDLKAFHRRALDIGSVGLDVLRAAVLDEL